MSHGLQDVTLVHGLQEVTSERPVISLDQYVTSSVLWSEMALPRGASGLSAVCDCGTF